MSREDFSVLPESDIHDSKLFGASCVHHFTISLYHARFGVLATAEEEIKCNGYEVSDCPCMFIFREVRKMSCHFRYFDWYCELWNGGWVLTSEAFG